MTQFEGLINFKLSLIKTGVSFLDMLLTRFDPKGTKTISMFPVFSILFMQENQNRGIASFP
jgi:hypothetical protein